MPGRKFVSGEDYRFGFNGKEDDRDWGTQNIQDYGFRLYNPSIGKFLSVDPLAPEYPELTCYQFASNTPLWAIDLDGLEAYYATETAELIGMIGEGDVPVRKVAAENEGKVCLAIESYHEETGMLQRAWNKHTADKFSEAIPIRRYELNTRAFLSLIRRAEGDGLEAPQPYNIRFGGKYFDDYDKHPNIIEDKWGYKSDGAGAYGIMYKGVWVGPKGELDIGLKADLGLKDFSPASQDAGAVEIMRIQSALEDVREGNTKKAYKILSKNSWPSLPGGRQQTKMSRERADGFYQEFLKKELNKESIIGTAQGDLDVRTKKEKQESEK